MVAAGVEWRAFFLVRLEGIACVSIVVARGSGRRGGAGTRVKGALSLLARTQDIFIFSQVWSAAPLSLP